MPTLYSTSASPFAKSAIKSDEVELPPFFLPYLLSRCRDYGKNDKKKEHLWNENPGSIFPMICRYH